MASDETQQKLQEAIKHKLQCELNFLQVAKDLPEFHQLKEAELRVTLLGELLVKNSLKEDPKSKLIKLGFEVRTGHKTSTRGPLNVLEEMPDLTFVIVHKARPQIQEVSFRYWGLQITPDHSEVDFKDFWVLAYGKTEDDAWAYALEFAFATDSLIPEALEGINS